MQMRTSDPHSWIGPKSTVVIGQNRATLIHLKEAEAEGCSYAALIGWRKFWMLLVEGRLQAFLYKGWLRCQERSGVRWAASCPRLFEAKISWEVHVLRTAARLPFFNLSPVNHQESFPVDTFVFLSWGQHMLQMKKLDSQQPDVLER